MTLSRLSDQNIADPILRAHYHQIVIEHASSVDSDLIEQEISLDEAYRPDLLSYRVYGDSNLAWLVALICEVDDLAEPLPVGETIYLPQASWIRRSMREFQDEFGISDA